MIQIISGTNRPDSNTLKVANDVLGIYEELNVDAELLDLAKMPPEIFFPGSYAEKPVTFEPFSQAVLEADGLHIITPEYNGSMPGVLKYFIDMLKFPESFEKRPVAFVGLAAGSWGALRAVEQLQTIFGYRNAYLYPDRVFIPGIHSVLDEEGKIKDESLQKRLCVQADGFSAFTQKLKN